MTDTQLDERILVKGIGMGWVATKDGDRVHIEFPRHIGAEPITIPSAHVGTELYEPTGDVTTALEHMAPSDD